jgi:hypothetical protein
MTFAVDETQRVLQHESLVVVTSLDGTFLPRILEFQDASATLFTYEVRR